MNRAVLVGRLTRDPDLRYTPNGVAVANFNLAVNRPFKDQNGESQADFINCVAWRKQAENLANFMKKGSQIGIDGRIQTRSYEDKDGKMVYVTEVVADSIQFLDSRKSETQRNNETNQQQAQQQSDPFQEDGQAIDISDDELPF